MKERRPAPSGEADGIIEGRNAVTEALRAGTPIDKIYLARGETDAALGHIASTARSKGVVVVECDRRKLDGMSRTHSHQGVIALAAVREYASVDDILEAGLQDVVHAGVLPHRRRRGPAPVRRGFEGPGRHRHRQRGGRHGPPCGRDLRLQGAHTHAGEAQLPQRFRGGGHPAL